MTKLPLLFLLASSLFSASIIHAQTVEPTPATATDLARELGITLHKFSAKFDQPVYATFEVKVFVEGEEDVTIMQQVTSEALKQHDFTFSMKDMNALAAAMGVAKSTEAKGAVDVSVKHPLVGFTKRLKNPFWQLKPGYTFLNWARPANLGALELEKMLPLIIQGGPYQDAEHRPKDLSEGYEKAPAYIWFGVKFTKLKPVEEEEEKEKPAK